MILFEDKPDFSTCYTPLEMFSAGIFGGSYFKIKTRLPDEFIEDSKHLNIANDIFDKRINLYGVECGASLEWWLNKNLIHPDDPNGWVEWYVKFYYGRRHLDDDRQIKRCKSFITRHMGMLNGYVSKGKDSKKTRQNLLQWSWDSDVQPIFSK